MALQSFGEGQREDTTPRRSNERRCVITVTCIFEDDDGFRKGKSTL
jgi:hypothetical protein